MTAQLTRLGLGWFKAHALRHRMAMFVPQVAVGLHRECASIFVSQPAADCWNIDAGFDAGGGKKVAKVMMSKVWKPEIPAGSNQTFFGIADPAYSVAWLDIFPLGFDPEQQFPQC